MSHNPKQKRKDQPEAGKPKQPRFLVITEDGIQAQGFASLYEVFGFIDLACEPNRLKAMLKANANRQAQQALKGLGPQGQKGKPQKAAEEEKP